MTSEEFYESLPRKRSGACALIFNEHGEVLVLYPNYKNTWILPGGHTEDNESPKENCLREVKEELGLDISIGRLLCVDYVKQKPPKGESLVFIFEGGILSDKQINKIKLQEDELTDLKFVKPEEALKLFGEKLKFRMQSALKALEDKTTLYIENGA